MEKTKKKIAVLKGDGIGVEVTNQALKVLDTVSKTFKIDFVVNEFLIGGVAIDNEGTSFPESTLNGCKKSDAVLLGAVGGKKWDNLRGDTPEAGLLKIRKELDVYANLRPISIFPSLINASPIKKEVIENVDLLIVRELVSGIYFGNPRGFKILENGEKVAFNTMIYSYSEISRIAHIAFKAAMSRQKKLCMVDKANVLEVSKFWREVVSEISKLYNDVELSFELVDSVSMNLIKNPRNYDVILTSNLFGDILSDEASQISGSIGLLPSASIGDTYALYEPIHGSAPDIAGRDIANPIASILSLAMMFEFSFKKMEIANHIRKAIKTLLDDGIRSFDLSNFGAKKIVGCNEMGDLLAKNIEKIG